MSQLADRAQALGLKLETGPPGEIRAVCDEDSFAAVSASLAGGAFLSDLFACVADAPVLRAVFSMPCERSWLLLSTRLSAPRFKSLTPSIHAASWYEREIREMFGLQPEGHPAPVGLRLYDWPDELPPMTSSIQRMRELGSLPERDDEVPMVHGQGVFQLPLGPVRSGPQESAEFLFNSGGEDLVMVSPRLGYKFRAVERLAEGKSVEDALLLAERLAGTSSFSNALAFTQAAERALGVEPPAAAAHSRTLLNELERLYSHLGNLSRVADSTGLVVPAAQYAILKEEVLRGCGVIAGHRYLRGMLTTGGLTAAPTSQGLERLRQAVPGWTRRASRLDALLEDSATFMDRLETTAILPDDYAQQHNLLGPIGRSTGSQRDVRRDHPYAAYPVVDFLVPVRAEGDALARVRVLLFEVDQSLRILDQLLGSSPAGEVQVDWEARAGSALGWAEAPGGETLHFVELDERAIVRRWRARPPACVNWHPYAYACASGNNLTDYPVIEASFALSHAEFDR